VFEHHPSHDPYGNHETDDLETRAAVFETTVLEQVSTSLIMGLIETAAAGSVAAWDAAAAVYTGCGEDSGADLEDTLYGQSDAVGLHFGTIQKGDSPGASLTNTEVMQAFQAGYSPESAAMISRAVQRTAWQSLLRYAHLIDRHFKYEMDWLETQGKGWAAWRVLEAAVARDDPERAAAITAVFAMQEAAPEPLMPNNYCYILNVLEEDLGLANDEAFGVFTDAMSVDCESMAPVIIEFEEDHDHDHDHDRDRD